MRGNKEFNSHKAKFRDAILHSKNLTFAARLVGYEIADHLNNRSGDAWPGQAYLAERLDIDIRTVRRVIKDIVRDGWFTKELDGPSWRYVPNYSRMDRTPDKMSGIDSGHFVRKHRTFCPKTPDSNVPQSSLRDPTTEPTPVCGQPDTPSNSDSTSDEGSGQQQEVVVTLADQSEEITKRARRGGAPVFVYEGSEPWRAWSEHRRRCNIPGDLPKRQRQIDGRLRTGWDCPTLYPPGFKREGVA